MRIFQPLCTQAVLNQIHWGTKYFSELSAPPLVGRHIGLKPSWAQIVVVAVDERAEVDPVTVAGGARP